MGDEDRDGFMTIIKVPLQTWIKAEIGNNYTINVKGKKLKGTIMGKLDGCQLSVHFPKPENMA